MQYMFIFCFTKLKLCAVKADTCHFKFAPQLLSVIIGYQKSRVPSGSCLIGCSWLFLAWDWSPKPSLSSHFLPLLHKITRLNVDAVNSAEFLRQPGKSEFFY